MNAGNIDLITKTADLVVKYGFLGVGLVLVVIIAPAVFKYSKSKTAMMIIASFGVAFIITWGALDIVQRYFPNWIQSQRVLLSGVVWGVPNGFQVQIASDLRNAGTAYVKRENDPQARDLNNFFFILVSRQTPKCLSVAINNNNPQSESGSSGFNITPISIDDIKSNTNLVAAAAHSSNAFRLRVWREIDEQQVGTAAELTPLSDITPGCVIGLARAGSLWDWVWPAAFAQAANSIQDFSVRLKSDDLSTRRNARIDLSKQGQNTIDITRQFLNSGDYRLQLGALVALSIMPEQDRRNLPPDVLAKVREFKSNSDATIRETANRIEPSR